MKLLYSWSVLLFAVLLVGCQQEPPAAADPEALKFAEIGERADLSEGYFSFARLKDTGELYMVVQPDQLDKEVLHLVTTQDGLAVNWTMRGGYQAKRILRLRRDYDKVIFEQINTQYYFDPDSPLSKSAEANLPPSVLAVAQITDENDDGALLLKVAPVFLTEALHQISEASDPAADPASTFALGELNSDKTRLKDLRTYPENIDLLVNYVYENPKPLVSGGPGLTDDRVVVLVVQHSLVKLPDNDFQPRFEDPRIGYFTDRVTDQTSHSPTPYRDPIHRFNLVKKNPGAELSDPVEPIVFWLENTTPLEHRETIKDAVLTWNRAFESAGFTNAIEVRIQADDAEWDAADIRYNVLRWTASNESPWSGYGPRFTDPRTGQIVGADIMLEFRWLTSHLADDRDFSQSQLLDLHAGASSASGCQLGAYRQSQFMVARSLADGGLDAAAESELVKQSLYDLVTHEVGHTLGLNHNFIGSHYLSPAQLSDPDMTKKQGVTASVMDYLTINFAAPGEQQPNYYPLEPGVYDHWAIEFGYSEALPGADAEQKRLQAILGRSNEPGLAFGHDADDMRRSSSGIDPRFMIFDHSSDPLVYASQRIALIENRLPGVVERLAQPGESWQEVLDAYLNLTGEWSRQIVVASRWVGGMRMDRSMQGQEGAQLPLQPLPKARQQQAMQLLSEHLFAPEVMAFASDLYPYLQEQRRGFDLWNRPQDPKVLGRTLAVQTRVLDHLLHPATLTRINDTALYGNDYSLTEMLTDLSEGIFNADMQSAVNPKRQQLQREYIERLIVIADVDSGQPYDHISRSMALSQLLDLVEQIDKADTADLATTAHRQALQHRIETALDLD